MPWVSPSRNPLLEFGIDLVNRFGAAVKEKTFDVILDRVFKQ